MIYQPSTANHPRNATDRFFGIPGGKDYSGWLDRSLDLITDLQLRSPETWRLFAEQFRIDSDEEDAGWRCEYWGKMMRGACFVYEYSRDEALYAVLQQSVLDLLETQDQWGRISTYPVDREFDGWDLWGRKYVLLGLQYFMEISGDEALNRRILHSLCAQVDYLISKIGPGKKCITKLTRHWRGLNSSSILEPIVRLYSLTGNQAYLDFAGYIVDCGFTDVANLIELALEKELRLYQYPVTKAYEMTSCFMGLLEYYRITRNEKHFRAILNFADLILEDEFTVIGSAGCTHELFDHSAVRQANPHRGGSTQQETCVTVTLMQFFHQLNLITGDPRYMDAFEISLYNGYLGAVNTHGAADRAARKEYPDLEIEPMPFDSYSPLTPGIRGNGIGGFRRMRNGKYYGCCVCIGPAGIGLAMKSAVLAARDGVVVNLYEPGRVTLPLMGGGEVSLELRTDYPACGHVEITVDTNCPDEFEILLRNPGWSENTTLRLKGLAMPECRGYLSLRRHWQSGDRIELDFDMATKVIRPIPYGRQILMNKVIWGANYVVSSVDYEHPDTRNHIALRRGPLMLARDNRLGGSVDEPVSVAVEPDGTVDARLLRSASPYPCVLQARIPTADGGWFPVTDYASAGKLWTDESKMAVWIKTE